MHKLDARIRTLAIGAVLGVVAGAAIFFVQPHRWQAAALVSIGRTGPLALIEEVPTVEERVRTLSFAQVAIERASNAKVRTYSKEDFKDDLSAKAVRNSSSLIIAFTADSPDLASAALESAVAELISKHATMFSQYQADVRSEITNLDGEIDKLTKKISAEQHERLDFSSSIWLHLLQHDLDEDIHRVTGLRDAISTTNMRPTSLLEPISVSDRRLFLAIWRACFFGFIIGIVAGMVWLRFAGGK